MPSLKLNLFYNLFYCFILLNCLINDSFTGTKNADEIVEVKFHNEERNITIFGVRNESFNGKEYYAFRGIRYVKPPVNELRFKDPQPLTELPFTIDARYDGHDCPSIYATNASEDCLTLNVYTPTTVETAALPVLVFIHPGGLYVGSALSNFIGPAYLLSKPLVLVTFNYRLGTLGFLQLGTREIPGNAGFKDQVYALRWVEKYIVHFGGNPKDITLMGYSAGALSVSLHLVSPMSRDLFQKAIIMSGSLPPQTVLPQHSQLELLRKQAHALQCTAVMNEVEILNCLATFSGTEIAATLRKLFAFGKDNPIYIYLPVIEKDYGQERFLIEDPYESLQNGAFSKLPILIGFANGEFCQSAVDIFKDTKLAQHFFEKFENVAPEIFMYAGHDGNLSMINEVLQNYYLRNSEELTRVNLPGLCDFFSDAIIRFGAHRLVELVAPYTKVFPYSFEFRGEFSNLDYPLRPARVEHMDDLMYLFEMPSSTFNRTESNLDMIRGYTKLVCDFVKEGDRLFGKIPAYPTGYTKIYRDLEFQPGRSFPMDTYEMWKRLFLTSKRKKNKPMQGL